MKAKVEVTVIGQRLNGGDFSQRFELLKELDTVEGKAVMLKSRGGAILSLRNGKLTSMRGPRLRILARDAYLDCLQPEVA